MMEEKSKKHIEDLYIKIDIQSQRIDNLIGIVQGIEEELTKEKKISNVLLDEYIAPKVRDTKTLAKAYDIIEAKDNIIQAKDELIGSMMKEIERLKNNRVIGGIRYV